MRNVSEVLFSRRCKMFMVALSIGYVGVVVASCREVPTALSASVNQRSLHPSAIVACPPDGCQDGQLGCFSYNSTCTDTLSVTVYGKPFVSAPSTQTYNVGIGNTSATSWSVEWYIARCSNPAEECTGVPLYLLASGTNLRHLAVPIHSDDAYVVLVAHVREANGSGKTGASVAFEIIGPYSGTGNGSLATSACDDYTDSFYPYETFWTDPTTGAVYREYARRNACTDMIETDPNHFLTSADTIPRDSTVHNPLYPASQISRAP